MSEEMKTTQAEAVEGQVEAPASEPETKPVEQPPKEEVPEVKQDNRSWLHKRADAVSERCAKREEKKAEKKKAKEAKKAEGGLTTGQKIGIGAGVAGVILGGLFLNGLANAAVSDRSSYELGESDVKELPDSEEAKPVTDDYPTEDLPAEETEKKEVEA